MARTPALIFLPGPVSRPRIRNRSHGRRAQRGGIVSKLIGLFVLVLLIGIVYLARHPLLRAAGRFWIVDEAPQTSDAILILGDDNYSGDRAARAAELYHAGWAPRIVASGRFLRPYASVAELTQRDLVQRGVPTQAVIRFTHRANDTREEIAFLSRLCSEQGWRRILLVTSSYHSRRARYIAVRTLPSGTELRVSAAHDSDYDPDSWWQSRLGMTIFFHEVVGMTAAMWEVRYSRAAAQAFVALRFRANPLVRGCAGKCRIVRLEASRQFTLAWLCTIVRPTCCAAA